MADPGQALVDGVYGDTSDVKALSSVITDSVTIKQNSFNTLDDTTSAMSLGDDKEHSIEMLNDNVEAEDEEVTDVDDEEEVVENYCERCEDTNCYCGDCRNPYYNVSTVVFIFDEWSMLFCLKNCSVHLLCKQYPVTSEWSISTCSMMYL